ncbi:MAG: sensor histidine kinase [Dissulfuribacterales bacterium]
MRHDIKFHTSIEPQPGPIEIDQDWLRTALVNLLENAIDACVSDPSKKEHRIDFTISAGDADHICFVIEDNGLGMDQETREKMFTLFFSSKGSKGTGLGLFISNHVISQHGGTIVVKSEIKHGSRFEICIPRTKTFNKQIHQENK